MAAPRTENTVSDAQTERDRLRAENNRLRARLKALEGMDPSAWRAWGRAPSIPGAPLSAVSVPEPYGPIFHKAQDFVTQYFSARRDSPDRGSITFSGERYVLIRAAALSVEFFDMVVSLYADRGEKAARNIAAGFLFDIAHAIGKSDARRFCDRMGLNSPLEKLSAGPIQFAFAGWAFVTILPASKPTPDDNFVLVYDHDHAFEAEAWIRQGKRSDFPVCAMSAGYSSGWCQESFDIPLVSVEIACRAKGDPHCRFVMAPPARIREVIAQYSSRNSPTAFDFKATLVPEFFQRKRLEDELLQSEETVRALLNAPQDRALLLDVDGRILAINNTAAHALGRSPEELIGRNAFDLIPESLADKRRAYHDQVVRTGRRFRYEDMRDGRWMDTTIDPVRDARGKVSRVAVVSRDVTDHKQLQEELRSHRDHLEARVRERTLRLTRIMEALRKREAELKSQSRHLEEANIALKVLLKQMEDQSREDHENILTNVKQTVLPYLKRLKAGRVSPAHRKLLAILETNLNNITSPLVGRLSSRYLELTPTEIHVAGLVKEGLTNKEIASALNTSTNTVSSHRYKIRSKLGLRNKGTNLRSYLLSLAR